ncbi:hypothetical protein PVAND_008165 [Polypedilum vanderplanki]|uniref:GPAT/DHAPAT C-terminal domain-containing protein n=1 Tax=Polypedilum vanderplanki TaxID=319348 RepID=A0A9J6C8X8_POLVA|nr:hypothetical protein PVAND_008165 [Polypedilum vanderplanki]
MGNLETPPVDKDIAAKMLNTSKLIRMKDYEERKKEKRKNLLTLKRTALPVIESNIIWKQQSKCTKCNLDHEEFDITFEWQLEPIDVLQMKTKGFFFGFNSYNITRRILMRIFKSLVIHPAQIKMIKYLQEQKPEMPIIYILKSNNYELDKVVLKFVLETFDLEVPIPIDSVDIIEMVENLKVYKSLMLSIHDETQLKMLLSATEFGKSKQVYLMPVSINSEIHNIQTVDYSFFGLLFPSHNYGIVKISLHEPYTFADLLYHIIKKQCVDDKENAIFEHLHYDIVLKRPVMSTSLIAFVLIMYFEKFGGSVEQIAAKVEEIRSDNPAIDFAFEGKSIDVVIYALKILDNKVSINEQLIIKPREEPLILSELWDYADSFICNYALQSALVLSAEYLKYRHTTVDYNDMIDLASDLCGFLQFEFPFTRACSDLTQQLSSAFDMLSRKELLTKPVKNYTENEMRARRIADNFEENEGYSDMSDYDDDNDSIDLVIVNSDKQDELNAMKNVLLPIQQAYLNVILCLKQLVGSKTLNEKEFLEITMKNVQSQDFKYGKECFIKWTKNCLRLCEMWKVIDKMSSNGNLYLYLTTEYNNDEEIEKFAEKLRL